MVGAGDPGPRRADGNPAARSVTASRPSAPRSPAPTARCRPRPRGAVPASRRVADAHHVGVVHTGAGKPRRRHRHRHAVATTWCASSCNGSGRARPVVPRRAISLSCRVPQRVVTLGEGMGVAPCRVHSAEELADARRRGFIEPGPHLIDAGGARPLRWPSPGRPRARWGTPAGTGVGPRPHKVGDYPHPRASGEHPHPRAGQVLPAAFGGSGRPDG